MDIQQPEQDPAELDSAHSRELSAALLAVMPQTVGTLKLICRAPQRWIAPASAR